MNFFVEKNNRLDHFFAGCYLFRNQLCEEVTDDSSEFINLLLKKITVYRTLVFIKFYETYIQIEIENNIKDLQKRIRVLYDNPNVVDEWENLSRLIRKAVVSPFHSDQLYQKLAGRQEDQQHYIQQCESQREDPADLR